MLRGGLVFALVGHGDLVAMSVVGAPGKEILRMGYLDIFFFVFLFFVFLVR